MDLGPPPSTYVRQRSVDRPVRPVMCGSGLGPPSSIPQYCLLSLCKQTPSRDGTCRNATPRACHVRSSTSTQTCRHVHRDVRLFFPHQFHERMLPELLSFCLISYQVLFFILFVVLMVRAGGNEVFLRPEKHSGTPCDRSERKFVVYVPCSDYWCCICICKTWLWLIMYWFEAPKTQGVRPAQKLHVFMCVQGF